MSWWQMVGKLGEPVRRWLSVFEQNKIDQAGHSPMGNPKHKKQADMKMQNIQSYALGSGSKWDAFIDGFNRLPRPLLTTAIVGFFVIAPLYPDEFLKIASAYEKLPNGFWALLSVVVGFYFTGRMQSKYHALQIHEALEEVVEREGNPNSTEKTISDDPATPKIERDYQQTLTEGESKKPNPVIKEWQAGRGGKG